MMTIQVTFDTADPHAQAKFWAAALGYEVEDHSALVDDLVAQQRMPETDRIILDGKSAFREVAACRDPAGEQPRFYFQKVPEAKTAKNRVHIDIPVSDDQKLAEVQRLTGLGARLLWETADRGARTYTMQDPEGNEFCLH
jgi:catechol 2,3-dioxygenase-like lactoylglutathione lyase family enzyme